MSTKHILYTTGSVAALGLLLAGASWTTVLIVLFLTFMLPMHLGGHGGHGGHGGAAGR